MSAAQRDLFGDDECEYDLGFIMSSPIAAKCVGRKWRECRDVESIRAPRLDNVRCFYCGGKMQPVNAKAYQERVDNLWQHKSHG
ncbi:MAG: hypothetical protein K8U57_21450 [Planctomycetes bacterium]|nr:hypothetical protein [Planctomycetota bacterium]